MRSLLLCLFAVLLLSPARAAEPFFKKGDVIALVGGEDMVVASEYGYLELLLTRALPDYHLRFRNLAWEGDTVFEQRRDLNFPSYEEQFDKIGATVVIAQFGQMESLAAAQEPRRRGGAEGEKAVVAEFIAAYEKLFERFSAGGKRRVIIVPPSGVLWRSSRQPNSSNAFANAVAQVAQRHQALFVGLGEWALKEPPPMHDGIHLNAFGHFMQALSVLPMLAPFPAKMPAVKRQPRRIDIELPGLPEIRPSGEMHSQEQEPLRQLIIAKNRLWFDYWRPQNWAFLAGDRTAQPSSRDHLDPSKRWFPPEREAFLPLIEAKEKQIDALAAELAAGNAGK